jgi:dolichyl-phosphate beta-glucosyltransferase
MKFDLSIIIPTYKEQSRIGDSLVEIATYLKGFPKKTEVIVIDANSPDQTAKIAKSKAKLFGHFRFVNDGDKQGKGKQVRDGIFEAKGRYVMFMDADLATPLKYLDDVSKSIDNNAPVSICVRDLQKTHKGLRKFISGFGNFLVQILILPGIKDSQCGFKSFETSSAKKIFSRQTILGWGFDMEILAIAKKLGYPIELIQVPDWQDITKGSKISGNGALKVALSTFADLLKIKRNLIFGRYKKPTFRYKP